jgi:hypothetical protein
MKTLEKKRHSDVGGGRFIFMFLESLQKMPRLLSQKIKALILLCGMR